MGAAGTYTMANAGISALSSIAGAVLSTQAFKAQLRAKTDASIANMNNLVNSYEYEAYKTKENELTLDAMYADKISETTLNSMKKMAYAKAAAAETGTSGGSTSEAVLQHQVDLQFDIAKINQDRKLAKISLLRKAEASRINLENQLDAIARNQIQVNGNLFLAGLAGATASLGGILSNAPDSVKTELFGYKTEALPSLNVPTSGYTPITK